MIIIYMSNSDDVFRCESDLKGYIDFKQDLGTKKFVEFDNKFINTSLIEFVGFREVTE